ncbi:DUF2339 domain-containing protein [Luteimonas kalidii]|uniref:DUF2339 domain-containing protein n=1 Tax=Luteimonas kalidii TaxID=3042025 RepID=A0ABT6JXB1_9GAMM|nr:DUF2339 domain-containing protein [Luteimonas kalidii]MDH5834576.1 DUF2339 domain-containing protein [Luteimonas kalidii]
MEGFLVLLGLAVLALPVLVVVALVSIGGLKRRVAELEDAVGQLRTGVAPSPAAREVREASVTEPWMQPAPVSDRPSAVAADTAIPGGPPEPVVGATGAAAPQVASSEVQGPDTGVQAGAGEARLADAAPAGARGQRPSTPLPPPLPSRDAAGSGPLSPPPPRTPPPRDFAGAFVRAVQRWFTVGNVPVKVGMLVLLAGVGALLKYANDQGWLQLPIELRLAGVSAAAVAGLVFGWRKRIDKPAFALALQGGAIGVLLLVVFAAFKLYGLLPAAVAFALSVVLVAGLGVLAVLQDSRTLAVLGILAGFLAPIWLSTGSGNHVALFSYYALLNAAIFAIAWMKSWRVLNLLGFAFTWGIGVAWGVLAYTPDKQASTQPFLVLFFVFYLLLPILYARRRPASRRDLIDGCLLFGTPLVAFSLQAALLEGARMPLALCALALAAVYAALAWTLRRRDGYALLAQAHALLAIGFATLSVPLALSANATASVFALEGAALAWLGLRQGRLLPQLAGLGLQLAAAGAYAIGMSAAPAADVQALANPVFMGALLIALAGFASAWSYRDAGNMRIAMAYYLWGLLWWCGNLHQEIVGFVAGPAQVDAMLAASALTGWLAAEVHRLRRARALAATALLALASAIPFALAQTAVHAHPFEGTGLWAWLAFAVCGVRSLLCLRGDTDRIGDWTQFVWWLVWPTVLALFAGWLAGVVDLAAGWGLTAVALPWVALVAASMWRWPALRTPRGESFDALRLPLQLVVFALLALWWLGTQFAAGDAAPLPWLPLFNPLEMGQLLVLVLLVRWLWSHMAPRALALLRVPLLSMAGFAWITQVTLRAVHHWGGVPWDAGMMDDTLAQTSLTVVWSLLGVIGWIAGSRRGQRMLWLAGAVLMGVVLAKLVLIDRQHLGDLLGIGSFIAYGLLCTLVGYFAPAPPRAVSAPQGAAA